jgi:hypothetical protein
VTAYADAETRLATWLHGRLGCKVWADPELPHNYDFNAPIGWLQRSAGEGDSALTLDSGIYDLGFYGKTADHVRTYAEKARYEIRYVLPGYTWDDGVTVSGTFTVSAPFWAPDPSVFRRSAAYRVVLHGLI